MTERTSEQGKARAGSVTLRMARFHLGQLLKTPFFLQTAILAPLSFALLKWLGSAGAGVPVSGSLWVDTTVAGLWASTTTAVGIIGFQRFQGTLELLAASVLSAGRVFGSLTAAAAALGLLAIPTGMTVQFLATGSVRFSWASLTTIALAVVACVASAGVLASLFVVTRRATAFEPLLLMPVWLISGVVIPAQVLPEWVQVLAWLHPLSGAVRVEHASTALEAIAGAGGSLAVSLVWLILANRLLSAATRRARVEGTLALS